MALERIVLNIIPAGEMPVFHCSQYENGRPVIIDLVSSDDDAFLVPEGATVELHCRKVDDNIVTLEPDEVDNNTVTFVSTEQLTACSGDNLCEVVLYADTDPVQTIATLNFILHVEPDPLEGGLTSESQIHNLTEQIEEITQQVIGDDYYNKTEVDNALALKANVSDLATVATTGDYDDLLNKPTIPAAQVQSDYAQVDNTQVDYIKNKPDIDAMIAAALLEVMPVGTASGPIANFDTELAVPLVNVSCDVVATGGNGTPDNPNPIVGYTEANITRCGVNLLGGEDFADVIVAKVPHAVKDTANKTVTYDGQYIVGIALFDKFKPNTQYTFFIKRSSGLANMKINYTDGTTGQITTFPQTSENNKSILNLSGEWQSGTSVVSYDECGVFEGVKTVDDFTPYTGNTYTIAFGQTVYGGVLDVTRGKLANSMPNKPALNDLAWDKSARGMFYTYDLASTIKRPTSQSVNSNIMCEICPTNTANNVYAKNQGIAINTDGAIWLFLTDYENKTVAEMLTDLGTYCLTYELATPFDIDLTPEVISAIVGTNNVFADCGETTVGYYNSIGESIKDLVEESVKFWTDISGTLEAGETEITLTNSAITTFSTIEVFNDLDVPYVSKTVSTGSITLTFDEQDSDMSVKVRVS